jgi:myxalamid-type polyketide synthase MxaE and MxaD
LAATKAKDAIQFYEPECIRASDLTGALISSESKCLLVAEEKPTLEALEAQFGTGHAYVSDLNSVTDGLDGFSRVVVLTSASTSALDQLDNAHQILKRVVSLVKEEKDAPEVWFVLVRTQTAVSGDLKGAEIPKHAGLWGLTRCLRLEQPGVKVGCVDLAPATAGPQGIVTQLCHVNTMHTDGLELETAIREDSSAASGFAQYAYRLADTTTSLQTPLSDKYFGTNGTYLISGGVGALGLLFAQWMADNGGKSLALLSRSGKPPGDSDSVYQKLSATEGVQVNVCKCDVAELKSIKALMVTSRNLCHQ